MRLIDADNLIAECENAICPFANGRMIIRSVIRTIKKQPTAYDVDKVVEQLDRISDEMNDMIIDLDADCPQYYDGYEDGVQRTIEIVKAGGVNG